jgi:putative addiction module component (TIGR02574 family)
MDLAADLYSQASSLPPQEREHLALRLLKSLPEWETVESPLLLDDDELAELERRSDRHRANPQAAITAEEGLSQLRSLVEGCADDDRADR